MRLETIIKKNNYRDSVFLMRISSSLNKIEGVDLASAMMATVRNKELFEGSGLLDKAISEADPNDLAISIRGEEAGIEEACQALEELLADSGQKSGSHDQATPTSIEEAVTVADANIAFISTAGQYAKLEAAKALNAGLHVMLFSDNISLEDEIKLKRFAQSQSLLLMGPDCGTAILNGAPLGFTNALKSGGVGIVGASGTGIQEYSCLIDRMGLGVGQIIGTGGRDLKDAVGGITTLMALDILDQDADIDVIAIISKPAGGKTRKLLCERLAKLTKPVVIWYAGSPDYSAEKAVGGITSSTLEEAALVTCKVLGVTPPEAEEYHADLNALPRTGQYLRGVFSGGSLCYESMDLCAQAIDEDVFSNGPAPNCKKLPEEDTIFKHCFLDMGEDYYTAGKPHPMIAPELKMEKLSAVLADQETAAVIIDIVIGYGSAPGQAELVVETIGNVPQAVAGKPVFASVTGTESDSPARSSQMKILSEAGIHVFASNAKCTQAAINFYLGKQEK